MAMPPKSRKPSTGRPASGKPAGKSRASAAGEPGQTRRRTAGTTISQPALGSRSANSAARAARDGKPAPVGGRGSGAGREPQSGYESGFSVEEGSRQRRSAKGGPGGSSFGGSDPARAPHGAKPRPPGEAAGNTRRGAPAARGEAGAGRSAAGPRNGSPARSPSASGPTAPGTARDESGTPRRVRSDGGLATPPARVKRGDGPRHDGGYGPPTQRVVSAAELEVEPARKMRVRRGSEKQVQVAQELRQKRVETSHIGALRLQKALAVSGVGSRRDCDEWVEQGRVSVDGKIALPGTRVEPGQVVRFDGKIIQIKWPDRLPRVVLYHKQEGELVSRDDPEGRTTVFERLPKVQSSAWVAIGRLDFNTSGLLVFTTSGDLANRMMHPRFEVEREYAVRVLGELTEVQRKELLAGIPLDDGVAKFEVLESQGGEGRNHWYRVILREGRNREVRRMFEHYELTVSRLMRVRFGVLALPSRLKRGEYYELDETEVLAVLKWADLGMTGREKGPRVRIEEHIQAEAE